MQKANKKVGGKGRRWESWGSVIGVKLKTLWFECIERHTLYRGLTEVNWWVFKVGSRESARCKSGAWCSSTSILGLRPPLTNNLFPHYNIWICFLYDASAKSSIFCFLTYSNAVAQCSILD